MGLKKLSLRIDVRLPITIDILSAIVNNLDTMSLHVYDKSMYKAMFCVAFFGFLRVSEFTHCSNTNHCICYENVSISHSSVNLTLLSFKHSKSPVRLSLPSYNNIPAICPVRTLSKYLSIRGRTTGPLFIDLLGKPVTRMSFSKILSSSLSLSQLDSSRYKGHSFRIGAATHSMMHGLSDAHIRQLGRWNSNAFKAYIRP